MDKHVEDEVKVHAQQRRVRAMAKDAEASVHEAEKKMAGTISAWETSDLDNKTQLRSYHGRWLLYSKEYLPLGETTSHELRLFEDAKDLIDAGKTCPGGCAKQHRHRCGTITFNLPEPLTMMLRLRKVPRHVGDVRKVKLLSCQTGLQVGKKTTMTFLGDGKMRLLVKRSVLEPDNREEAEDLVSFAGVWEDPKEVERQQIEKAEAEERRRNHRSLPPKESMAMDFVNGNGWMWGW